MVPDHIPRPDYADHAEGFPISEQRMKGNTYVRQLDAEEIEDKRNRKVSLIAVLWALLKKTYRTETFIDASGFTTTGDFFKGVI